MFYANIVREVKSVEKEENLTYDITTRRAKSGNIILEIPEKEHVDHLAEVLKIMVFENGRRKVSIPEHTNNFHFIGIEDSVNETELKSAPIALDDDHRDATDILIHKGRIIIRTAIIRVPLKNLSMQTGSKKSLPGNRNTTSVAGRDI